MAKVMHLQRAWRVLALYLACLLAVHTPPTSGVQLPKPTGLTVQATPQLACKPGTRYKGSLHPDPQKRATVEGSWQLLPQLSPVIGVHIAAIPNTNKYLYMERPSDQRIKRHHQIAGTFDLVTRQSTWVDTANGLFCAGHVQTSDGQICVAGGHRASGGFPFGMDAVRLFNIRSRPTNLTTVTYMQWDRWYPSLTLLPDQRILIQGGTPTVGGSGKGIQQYELFDPANPYQKRLPFFMTEQTFYTSSKKMYYPFNFVLPTGDVFSFSDKVSRIFVAQTGKYRQGPNGKVLAGPYLPGADHTEFPFTASAAFTPLTWRDNYSSVEIIIFGGAPVETVRDNLVLAGRSIRRMKISWSRKSSSSSWQYSFGAWQVEDLLMPRVMPDAITLPNGDVVIVNGGQVGCAGDASDSRGNGGRSDYPAFWAQLYQPNLPAGKRVTIMAASGVARMYHGVAALTINGSVLVTGCDRAFKLHSDVPGYKSPLSRWEYRQEIFRPPYYFDTAHKPRILSVSGSSGTPSLGYNKVFTITWGAAASGKARPPVTSVMLVAPSSVTHNFNFNQHSVELQVTSINVSKGTLQVRSPPHPYIAPPQYYMVFLNNGKTYSDGHWLRLVDYAGQGKVVPK